jgi:Fe-S-cluster containining protein
VKRQLLERVYEAYDESVRSFESACRRECSACCTHNVITTTLEADLLKEHLEKNGLGNLAATMLSGTHGKRLQPKLTINELAQLCMERKEPPEESDDYDIVPCPFRDSAGCPAYEARPFACRSMWSEVLCEQTGQAGMHPVLVTLNGVFQQIIEDIDQGGLSGNLADVLEVLDDPAGRQAYHAGKHLEPVASLIENRPNPGFLVPPEHRPQVMSALERLWQKQVQGMPFKEALNRVRAAGSCVQDKAG